MSETRGAAGCRWSTPTLFLASPAWADAEDRPWTCLRDQSPHELESTEPCAACPRWEPRDAAAEPPGEPGTL